MAKLPDNPNTRLERYLARLAGQDVSIPDTPINRIECYLAYLIENGGGAAAPNAGAHNAIFRGKSLGTSFTEAQADAIDSGTFEDIFIGDYWTIGNIVYRVAGLDTYLNIGDPPFSKHHAVVVSDTCLGSSYMNQAGGIAGGYYNSDLNQTGLTPVINTVLTSFGEGHVLTRRSLLTNGVGTAAPNAWAWYSIMVDIMNESQVIGRGAYGTQSQSGFNLGERLTQLPLFNLHPSFIKSDQSYWLQDIRNASGFCRIALSGYPDSSGSSNEHGIRPYFCVGKAS